MKLNIGNFGRWFSKSERAKEAEVEVSQRPMYDPSQAMAKIEFAIRTWCATEYLEFIGSKDTSSANITASGGHNLDWRMPYASQPAINMGVFSLPEMWGRGLEGYLMAQVVISDGTDHPFRGNLRELVRHTTNDFSKPHIAYCVTNTTNRLLEAAKKALQVRPLSSDREAELFSQGMVYALSDRHSPDLEYKVSGGELEAFKLGESIVIAAGVAGVTYGLLGTTAEAIMKAREESGKYPRMFDLQVQGNIIFPDNAFGKGIGHVNYFMRLNREGNVANPVVSEALVSL